MNNKYITLDVNIDNEYEIIEVDNNGVILNIEYLTILPQLDIDNIVFLKTEVIMDEDLRLIDIVHFKNKIDVQDGVFPYLKIA